MNLLSVSTVLLGVWSVVLAILILLAMITIHEFGHYIAGRILKFKINEFAIGFGPALFKRENKKTGEFFSIRAIPLGGYCAFEGEEEDSDNPDSFEKKAPWKRIIVLVAGATMNYLLALLLIIVSFFSFGQYLLVTYKVEPPVVETEYCFQDLDIILECEGKSVYLTSDVMNGVREKEAGELVTFVVSRVTGETREKTEIQVMLRSDTHFENSTDTEKLWRALGIAEGEGGYEMRITPVRFGFFTTIGRSFSYSVHIAGSIFQVLGELLTGALGLNAMGGPVSTIQMTSQIAVRGVQSFLEIASYIGVNLAVFNLLPIPALDGSKVIFTLIEWIRGKPINRRIEGIIHTVGFIALLGFAILVDLLHLF